MASTAADIARIELFELDPGQDQGLGNEDPSLLPLLEVTEIADVTVQNMHGGSEDTRDISDSAAGADVGELDIDDAGLEQRFTLNLDQVPGFDPDASTDEGVLLRLDLSQIAAEIPDGSGLTLRLTTGEGGVGESVQLSLEDIDPGNLVVQLPPGSLDTDGVVQIEGSIAPFVPVGDAEVEPSVSAAVAEEGDGAGAGEGADDGVDDAPETPEEEAAPTDTTASDPLLTVEDVNGAEDGTISLKISSSLTDTDGSETLSLEISGIPAGAVLRSGGNIIEVTGGAATLTQEQLSNLTLTPPENSSGSFDLSVTATGVETSTGDTASVTDSFSVDVSAVADTPTLAAQDVSGDEDTAIQLDIAASLTDLDGSETLAIELSNIPDGAVLSAGGTPITINAGTAQLTQD